MVLCTVYCFCKPANVGKFVKGPPPDPLETDGEESEYERSDSDIRRFLCVNSPRPVRKGEKSVEFYGQ
jgi:hypothetical protein